eukprot:11752556-Prorocentrum_lima.AAC.1
MQGEHRPRTPEIPFPENLFVARSVRRQEIVQNPDAQAALKKEWDRLRKIQTWDESKVREWRDVRAEAQRAGKIVHVGRIFEICVEKNHELPKGHPLRKYKGR